MIERLLFIQVLLFRFYLIVDGWQTSWGTMTVLPAQTLHVVFASFDGGISSDPVVTIPYGSPAQEILDVCLQLGKSVEDCEEALDRIHSQWFYIDYTPTLVQAGSKPNWESDFSATRATIISLVSEKFNYQRYLEIGTDTNKIFDIARTKFPIAVGVDPRQGGTLKMTSDEFFTEYGKINRLQLQEY